MKTCNYNYKFLHLTERSVINIFFMSPRTEQQFEDIRREKVEHIKLCALQLFAENGYDTTPISKIAKVAGISKGLIYNYFSSKEELLKEILISGLKNFISFLKIEEIDRIKREEIIAFVDGNLNLLKQNTDYYKLYFSLVMQPKTVQLLENEMRDVFGQIFEKFIHYFEQQGEDQPYVKARYLLAIFDGIGIHYIIDPERFPLDEIQEILITKI